MLREEIDNDELFFGSLRRFLNEFADSTATGLDFLDVVNRHTGGEYRWFFDQWYFGKGFPNVSAQYSAKPGYVKLTLNQTPSDPSNPFFRMKVKVRVLFGTTSRDTVLNWTENEQVFTIPGSDRPTGVIVDPDQDILMLRLASVGVDDETHSDIRVYPVPFTDRLFIDLGSKYIGGTITVSDISGRLVWQSEIAKENMIAETSNWSNGAYIYRVAKGISARAGVVMKY